MKKSILIPFFWLIGSINATAHIPVDIAENTVKVNALGEESFYYGFAEGDQIVFNFQEMNGKELKEIEIIELPSFSKFMDYKTKKVENKIINVARTSIYKFRLSNSSLSGRICKIKIQRIPKSNETIKFNSSVYWKIIQDTTYTPTEERYLVKSDTFAREVYSSIVQLSSTNALNGNKNNQVLDFTLPRNTISWSFYIAAGAKGSQEYINAREQFAKNAAASMSKIPGYGPLAALAITGVSYFSKVQGEDNVKYWFLSDANSKLLFESGQTFYQYKMGDVINEASQMKRPLSGKVYLALKNDNIADPIKVTLNVVAIEVIQEWSTRIVQVMKVANREVPYLRD